MSFGILGPAPTGITPFGTQGALGTPSPAPGSLLPAESPYLPNGQPDLSNVSGLLAEADSQGGVVAEQANSLAYPNTGILSTISNGFKGTFSNFMKVLGAPGAAVASGLSGLTGKGVGIGSAISQGLKPDQVLFGDSMEGSTMEKVGGFIVRNATDILLDPTTYLTFGAGEGIMGLKALSEVPLLGDAAKAMSVEEGTKVAVNKVGQDVYGVIQKAKNFYDDSIVTMGHEQAMGTAMAKFFQTGSEVNGQAGEAFLNLLKQTMDLPADSKAGKEFTQRAMSALLSKYPHLTETIMDKGGIKVFGNTIIEGARVRNAIAMIPGMTTIDHFTAPTRNMISGLFSTSFSGLSKLPQEYVDLKNTTKTEMKSLQQGHYSSLYDLAHAHGLNVDQAYMVRDAMENRAIPADTKLAKAYLDGLGISPDQAQLMRKNGFPLTDLNGHTMAHVSLQKQIPVKPLPFKATATAETGATKFASLGKFIEQKGEGFEPLDGLSQSTAGQTVKTSGEQVLEKLPKEITALKDVPNGTGLIGKIAGAGSTQEAAFAVGDHIAGRLNELVNGAQPMTFENAFNSPEIKQLIDTQSAMRKLTPAKQLVGDAESLGLKESDIPNTYLDSSGKTYQRMAATLQELHDAGFDGFDPNFYTASLSRYYDIDRASSMKHFYSDVATQFGKKASEAPTGWRAVQSKGLSNAVADVFKGNMMQDGEEMYFHPDIAKDIEKFTGHVINDEATNELLKTYDKIQGAWKASVTSVFPAFHGRNAVTHAINNFLDLGYHAFDPATHYMAGQWVWKERQVSGLRQKALGVGEEAMKAKDDLNTLLNTKMFTDNAGHDWTHGEITQMVKDTGIAFGEIGSNGPEDMNLTNEELAEKLAGNTKPQGLLDKANPFNQNFGPYKQGRAIGSALANQARMVNFISNLKNTGDVQLAAARVKQFMFDYGNLTNFEKTFARRLVPFYTFTRSNLALQAHSILTTPGRIQAELNTAQNLGDAITGNKQLNPEEKAALPDWLKEGLYSVTSKQGENVTIQKGFQTPIEQPFEALKPNAILGSISPIIRVPIEQATGYSFFQGKPLSQITNATAFQHAPSIVKRFIGYTEATGVDSSGKSYKYFVSLKPSNMNLLLNLPPTTRVFSSLKQIETADESTQDRIMQQLIGQQAYNFNLSVEAQRQQNAMKANLQQLLQNAHLTANYTDTYIPKNNTVAPQAATPQKQGFPFAQAGQLADLVF